MKAQPGAGAGPQTPPPDRGLSRSQRLTRNAQFQEIFAQGRSLVGRFMVLWVREGEDTALRLGVITSRKVGGAVARTKARRRLREAWRLNRHLLSGKVDVILVARRAIQEVGADRVEQELQTLCKRAGLLE